ncbi:MAG: DUF4340 domain-containing protein [Nitrospirota bacterium]
MSRSVLVLFILALGLGLYLWLVEMPMERKRAYIETESKQLVNFKDSDVQSFALHSATGDLEITRSDGDRAGAWTIRQPRTMDADRPAVEQFLRTLILAKVSRIVDDSGKDLSAYGLAVPSMSVSMRLPSGNQTLLFGDAGPLSSSLYAKREGDSRILLTSLSAREILTKGLQDFRRKRVLEFDPARVTRLKIANPHEVVILYKEGQGEKATWIIKAPLATTADQPEVRSLLFRLEDLKAQGFIDDPKERRAKKKELQTPLTTITVHEDSPGRHTVETDQTISLFVSSKSALTAYGETSPQEPLYLIPAASAKDLAKNLFALRTKQLMAAAPDHVKTLVIKKGGEEYALTHEGTDWLIEGDPGKKADAGRINTFVSRILRLQAERIVTDKPQALKAYGLAFPVAEVTVADPQGKVLGRLAVGRQENHLAFAQGSAISGVLQIRPDILQEIPTKSELMKSAVP